jgi:serine/threonine-protein kinase HipA
LTRTAQVFLHDLLVGVLREDESGFVEFRMDKAYLARPERPVLGQWFEDHPRGIQRGERPGELPSFFANLVPEGDLALLLRERLQVPLGDDLGLLCAVGDDLPGALVLRVLDDVSAGQFHVSPPPDSHDQGPTFRFSLAGVQLKFSMARAHQRFQFPGRGATGDWIAKIALDPYVGLCENEFATMEWARAAGFEVPACELRPLSDLVAVPYEADARTGVFVIRRYDRAGEKRIHQEDFQQVLGRRPVRKYDDLTYEALVLLAMKIVGDDVYTEMVRRLTFVIASGNNDAHAKNWSLLYPDGVHARLTPLYDQVFTAQWPQFSTELALKLGGTKQFAAVEMGRFRTLAQRLGADVHETERLVTETLDAIATAWMRVRELQAVTPEYRRALGAFWRKVPILTPYASRIA